MDLNKVDPSSVQSKNEEAEEAQSLHSSCSMESDAQSQSSHPDTEEAKGEGSVLHTDKESYYSDSESVE